MVTGEEGAAFFESNWVMRSGHYTVSLFRSSRQQFWIKLSYRLQTTLLKIAKNVGQTLEEGRI